MPDSLAEALKDDPDLAFAGKLSHLQSPGCTWEELTEAMFEGRLLCNAVLGAMLTRMERLSKIVADLAGAPETHVKPTRRQ